jgi:hypothetical protein
MASFSSSPSDRSLQFPTEKPTVSTTTRDSSKSTVRSDSATFVLIEILVLHFRLEEPLGLPDGVSVTREHSDGGSTGNGDDHVSGLVTVEDVNTGVSELICCRALITDDV